MVKVRASKFRLLAGTPLLTAYQFHSRTATRHFCTVCGNYPFHRKRVTPQFLAINVYCLDDFDPAGIPVRATRGRMTK